MPIPAQQSIIIILTCAVVTFCIRAFPFAVFGGKRKIPDFVIYLGAVLPAAIISILIIYCIKTVSFVSFPHGLPELISIFFVAVIHLWKRSNLLSIGLGTVLYMILIQRVFI